jgi:hypothetical protein
MLLSDMTHEELAHLLERHADVSSLQHVLDPAARKRARRLAQRGGLWQEIAEMNPGADIPVRRRSHYRQLQRNGKREPMETPFRARLARLRMAALAVWLDHPAADVDHVQDLLWAWCDDWTWVASAHEGLRLDLHASLVGLLLTETITVLRERLEDEVVQRVRHEIERRIFGPATAWNEPLFWKTNRANWNHVCNGQLIEMALCLIDDPRVLAGILHTPIQQMTYAVNGFTDDGGCVEGPLYWNFGFGHYLSAAFALHQRTRGELNIMTGEKIERVCRYPLACAIAPPIQATFADSTHGYVRAANALLINRFHAVPELLSCCERNADGTLKLETWHALTLGETSKPPAYRADRDWLLPDLGQVKLVGSEGPSRMIVAAIAGNNGVPHSHNDVGSFMVVRGGRLLLEDPGSPIYTRETFSKRRYECELLNSRGHSVPVIDGRLQEAGGRHAGKLTVEGINGDGGRGEKTAVIDMTRAYRRGTVQRLLRTLRLDPAANTLSLVDEYAFSREPSSLEEAFITHQAVRLLNGGQAVQIGPMRGGLTLRADDTPGRFHSQPMSDATAQLRSPLGPLTRITFVPATLSREMRLMFSMR